MRRNYAVLVAWILLISEFAIPVVAEELFPEWIRGLGPGGPYVAAFWLAALSIIGAVTAGIALVLSFHGFSGRIASVVVLGIHVIVGALPLIAVLRVIFGFY